MSLEYEIKFNVVKETKDKIFLDIQVSSIKDKLRVIPTKQTQIS